MDVAPINIPPAEIEVMDGDTIKYGRETIRLLGFDTPELKTAQCPAERRLGIMAMARLQELIDDGADTVLRPNGKRDRYNRVLAILEIDGRDVASIMIAEGHAVPYHGRGPRMDWCR
jgi:endonuclease YncB( thermonuclease family)